MGSYFTSTAKPVINDEINPFIPYICSRSNKDLVVDSDISLVIKRSELSSKFIEGKHMGLFTQNDISKGILKIVLRSRLMMVP